MKRLTRTGQIPAGQSTRRFPRAKSDRQQRSALTYLVSPRHRESLPSEFHVPDGRRRGCEKATGPAAALLGIFSLSLTLFPRALLSRFLFRPARPVRPSVRSFARSLAPSLVARPRTPLRDGGGGQTTRVLSNASPLAAQCTYIRDTRYFRLTPCLATTPFSTPQTNAGDTHGRFVHGTATRSARRAHTTPERVL